MLNKIKKILSWPLRHKWWSLIIIVVAVLVFLLCGGASKKSNKGDFVTVNITRGDLEQVQLVK